MSLLAELVGVMSRKRSLLMGALLLWLNMPCSAGSSPDPRSMWPAADRAVPTDRLILVLISQTALETSFKPDIPPDGSNAQCSTCTNLGQGLAAGALTGLLLRSASANIIKHNQAMEDVLVLIESSMKDYDFDASVAQATQRVTDTVPWVSTSPPQISRDESSAALGELIDSTTSQQAAIVRYHYGLVRDLSELEVTTQIALVDKQTLGLKNVKGHADFERAPFFRSIKYIVPLRPKRPPPKDYNFADGPPPVKPIADEDLKNARLWAAESDKRLIGALDAVIAKSIAVNQRALQLTQDGARAIAATHKSRACEVRARLIDHQEDGELCEDSSELEWIYQFNPIESEPLLR
jgi:hypothetical protein